MNHLELAQTENRLPLQRWGSSCSGLGKKLETLKANLCGQTNKRVNEVGGESDQAVAQTEWIRMDPKKRPIARRAIKRKIIDIKHDFIEVVKIFDFPNFSTTHGRAIR